MFTSATSIHRLYIKQVLLYYIPPLLYFFERPLQLLIKSLLEQLQSIYLSFYYCLKQLLTLIFFFTFDLEYLLKVFT